ncbi:MAG: sporulation protein YunB, partial [Acutalibacteraceae bacterium]
MRRYRSARKVRLAKTFRIILIFFIIFLILFIAVDSRMRPIIKTSAESYAVALSTKKINNSISEIIGNYNISYSQLVTLHYDQDSNVTSLTANIVEINKLKSEITSDIQDEINKYETQTIKIPIGNIIGSTYFMGYGPKIKIKLDISSSIKSDLLSNFSDAGINQTNHTIILRITTSIAALIPWFNTYSEVTTDFVIAE